MSRVCAAEYVNRLIILFIVSFIIYIALIMYTYNLQGAQITPIKKLYIVPNKIKYILEFSGKKEAPFDFLATGNTSFVKNNCKFTNCFVTNDHNFLKDADFDAVVFNGRDLDNLRPSKVLKKRSPKQKYIFAATESANWYPVCNKAIDNFFNWTWTYKLESNFRWGYITIYDTEGNKVGPAINMKWPEKMEPVSEDVKEKLSRKSKAAAWFVSNCKSKSKRDQFVAEVNESLQRYGHKVDVYGKCGELTCPRKNWRDCNKKVESDYFFYFSLENSFAEDYVTEKLLTALNNYAVPVVYGGADYSRFLPEGSYLDGRKLGANNLVRLMLELMADKTKYYEFFRWRNHFIYTETTGTADICNVCDALNDEQMVNTVSMWKNLTEWWNTERHKEHCP